MMLSVLVNLDKVTILIIFLELALLVGFEKVAVAIVLLLHPFLFRSRGLDT